MGKFWRAKLLLISHCYVMDNDNHMYGVLEVLCYLFFLSQQFFFKKLNGSSSDSSFTKKWKPGFSSWKNNSGFGFDFWN